MIGVRATDGSSRIAKVFGSEFYVSGTQRAHTIMCDDEESFFAGAGSFMWVGCQGLEKTNADNEMAIALAIQAYTDGDFYQGEILTG